MPGRSSDTNGWRTAVQIGGVQKYASDPRPPHTITRYATTLNPKAGFGLQRSSGRILLVKGLLCVGIFQKNAVLQGKKPLLTGEKVAKIQILLFSP